MISISMKGCTGWLIWMMVMEGSLTDYNEIELIFKIYQLHLSSVSVWKSMPTCSSRRTEPMDWDTSQRSPIGCSRLERLMMDLRYCMCTELNCLCQGIYTRITINIEKVRFTCQIRTLSVYCWVLTIPVQLVFDKLRTKLYVQPETPKQFGKWWRMLWNKLMVMEKKG